MTTDVSTRRIARSRGATSGILLVLLGAWGALAPFVGPLFSFAFTPDRSWHWTAGRGWYEVLPGALAALAGLLLLAGTRRGTTLLAAWLGVLAGGWFVVGPTISGQLSLGSVGEPVGSSGAKRALEILVFFSLLGAVILFLAAAAFGRLSVVSVRDVRLAERRAEADAAFFPDSSASRSHALRSDVPADRTDVRNPDSPPDRAPDTE